MCAHSFFLQPYYASDVATSCQLPSKPAHIQGLVFTMRIPMVSIYLPVQKKDVLSVIRCQQMLSYCLGGLFSELPYDMCVEESSNSSSKDFQQDRKYVQTRLQDDYLHTYIHLSKDIHICIMKFAHSMGAFVGSALGCWVKEGWDWLITFLQDTLLK